MQLNNPKIINELVYLFDSMFCFSKAFLHQAAIVCINGLTGFMTVLYLSL